MSHSRTTRRIAASRVPTFSTWKNFTARCAPPTKPGSSSPSTPSATTRSARFSISTQRLEKDNGPADRRPRIEHVQHLHPADYPRFAKLGVIASMQPYHAIDDGRWAEKVHRPRARPLELCVEVAARRRRDARLRFRLGRCAARRRRWESTPPQHAKRSTAKIPDGWIPEQRITVAQAVHAYTVGSAFAEHQEKVKGSIEPGKLADLVVLSDDIFSIRAREDSEHQSRSDHFRRPRDLRAQVMFLQRR